MIDYYNNETRLTEILRAVVNSSTIDMGPARTREEIFVSRAFGLTMWPAITPRTTMEMWLAFIAGDTAEPAAGSYTVRTCAESCVITYARRVRGASAVVPIFPPHTHYERALAKLAGIVPLDWGVLGREWEHLLRTLASTMPRTAVTVIGGEKIGMGPGGEISPYQDLHGYDNPWPAGGGVNKWDGTIFTGKAITATNGKQTNVGGTIFASDYVPINPSTEYYFNMGGLSASAFGMAWYDANKTYISGVIFSMPTSTKVGAHTSPSNAAYVRFTGIVASKDEISINYPGSVTTYVSYSNICPIYPGLTVVRDNGSTLEVWGGTLDTTSGELTATDAEIASYAGEALPGEWISDRDVYAAGTTPTAGAQVVYTLAEPVTYQLTQAEVKRALNCADYLGAGVLRLSCGGVAIIHAQIRTESPANHYDISASNDNWSFEITVDGVTVSGDSGPITVAAGDHDIVITATPSAGAGVCIIQPTLYYTAASGLLGAQQDTESEEPAEPEEPEDPAEPVEPEEPEDPAEPEEPKTTKRRRAK